VNVPLVLTDFLDRAVELYGEKIALIDDEKWRGDDPVEYQIETRRL
jgi:hypothetical protein